MFVGTHSGKTSEIQGVREVQKCVVAKMNENRFTQRKKRTMRAASSRPMVESGGSYPCRNELQALQLRNRTNQVDTMFASFTGGRRRKKRE